MSLTITDFILIYNLIPLSCFLVGTPNACINSSFLRLNQLTCETPSMLRLKLPSLSSLSEHIILSALKCWLNSREYSSPLMETSLNVHSFLITASPKFTVLISFRISSNCHSAHCYSTYYCCSLVSSSPVYLIDRSILNGCNIPHQTHTPHYCFAIQSIIVIANNFHGITQQSTNSIPSI